MPELMTKEDVLKQPWATEYESNKQDVIAIQYSPIVNWYAFGGFECPIDGTEWKWKYDTEGVQFTTHALPLEVLGGFEKVAEGHRVIVGKCSGSCGEAYYIHNFDNGV